ncbi:hypothetical protein [Millisia brevis]|uniref:hypothetical protein n=1 Tax=Millisia brevis TaxID=264148 RepID=UPI000834AA80|nr:hypothetical protein [Millisia brevis]
MSGVEIDPAQIVSAASGIQTIIRDMQTIGVDRIVGPDAQYGNNDLYCAFDEFCGRWHVGLTALLRNGEILADGLLVAIQDYERADGVAAAAVSSPREVR